MDSQPHSRGGEGNEVLKAPTRLPTLISHSGDLGDIIYCLPVLRFFEDPVLHFINRPFTKLLLPRLPFLTPLLDNIGIRWTTEEIPHESHLDMENFRRKWGGYRNITEVQQVWTEARTGMNVSNRDLTSAPWMEVEPSESRHIVAARSPRYHNPTFPWRRLRGMDVTFLGTDEEFREFEKLVPSAHHEKVQDALEMARVISSAEVFIGNQSFPLSLAIAMHKESIIETSTYALDCFHRGPFHYWCGETIQVGSVHMSPLRKPPTVVLLKGWMPFGVNKPCGLSFEDAVATHPERDAQAVIDWNAAHHPHWCGPKPEIQHRIKNLIRA